MKRSIERPSAAKSNGHRSKMIAVGSQAAIYVPTVSGEVPTGRTWTLYNGGEVDTLRQLPGKSVSCAVTSPPYFWQRDYGIDGQIGHESTISGYVNALVETFRQLRRVLKD